MASEPAALTPAIPDFQTWLQERKAVREREEKERRGAGVPWLPNFPASQSLGFAGKLALLLGSKLGILGVVAAAASTAAGAGFLGYLHNQGVLDEHRRKIFQTQLVRENFLKDHADAMAKSLPTIDGVRTDTLGFVKAGSFPDPAAAGGANQTAGGTAGGPAANAAAQAAAAAEQAADPNALAAAMAAQAQQGASGGAGGTGARTLTSKLGEFGSRFGASQFHSLIGGGGAGGAPDAKAGGNVDSLRGDRTLSLANNPLAKPQARQAWAANGIHTLAARDAFSSNQLRTLQAKMGAASSAGTSLSAKTGADNAWEAVQPTGAQLQDSGAGTIGTTGGQQLGNAPPPAEGAPIVGQQPASNTPNVPDVPADQNNTPYQGLIDAAKGLLAAATVLSAVAFALKFTPLAAWGVGLSYVVAAMGAAVMAIGGMLMGMYGQTTQGLIWIVTGGIVAVSSLWMGAGIGKAAEMAAAQYAKLILPRLAMTEVGAAGGLLAGDNFLNKSKSDYQQQYGVDPHTNQVPADRTAWFDQKYGAGAAARWNQTHPATA